MREERRSSERSGRWVLRSLQRERIVLCLLVLMLTGCGGEGPMKREHREDVAGRTLIETGELAAVTSKAFVMERLGQRWYDARIIYLAEHGQAVHVGDTLIILDPSNITRYITDRETALEQQQVALEKLIVNQSNSEAIAASSIRSEEATYELNKLSMQSARFESERQQRVRELQFRQATIRVERARRNLELNSVINDNDLKIQQIRVHLIEADVQRNYDLLPRLVICSPIDGIFQIERKRRWNPELLKVGDEVGVGQTIARVPDLTYMKVSTSVHENDFLRVAVGQKVTVRLDALPDVAFPGEISSVGRLCHEKEMGGKKVKVFDVEVRLLVSDERLKPGMTVSCEFHDKEKES